MRNKSILFVESPNDEHVFYALFRKHDLPRTFTIIQKGGWTNVLEEFRIQLKFQDENRLEKIGIVVDADIDIDERWKEIVRILERAGFNQIPETPHITGAILTQEGLPKVGIWLMPDNSLPGKIEDFISLLVLPDDIIWPYAVQAVSDLPETRFRQVDTIKAHVHTWLAWQEQPGIPMGWAISRGFLQHDTENARVFINWIERLFS